MKYVLDTDACVFLLRNREPMVSHVRRASPTDLAVTSMTEAELRYGARKSSRPSHDLAVVQAFLEGLSNRLPFDSEGARWHSELRYAMRSNPIGERDLVIASAAIANGCSIVTSNTREFARVPGLVTENWAIARPVT